MSCIALNIECLRASLKSSKDERGEQSYLKWGVKLFFTIFPKVALIFEEADMYAQQSIV